MKQRPVILAILLIVSALPLCAQMNDAEAFRADMLTYIGGLSRLSPEVRERYGATSDALARAADSIRVLPADQLLAMKVQMDRVPFWRDVPAIVAYTSMRPNGVPSPRELARGMTLSAAPYSPEMMRKPLLAFVKTFKEIPAQQVHPDYQQKLADIERIINEATPDQLMAINRDVQANIPTWENKLRMAAEGHFVGPLRPVTDSHCSQDFAGVFCQIGHVIDDVVAFFNNLPTYATNAFNSIKNIFSNLFSNFPATVSGALNTAVSLLGLNNVDWNQVAQTAQTYLKLPCPSDGTLLPGFGNVGEIRTFTNFSGTIGFAGNTLQDVMPSDILTSLDVQALVAVLNFPVQWLSHCLEKAYDDKFKLAQKTHRELVTAKLDVPVNSVASQDSENMAQAKTTNIDGDVVLVEAKLDRLGVVTDRTKKTTERIISTTDATEAVANRLETTSIRLDTTASRLESKVDNLQLQQGQTSDGLDKLKADYLRLLIENDLFRQDGFRISLFQLPQRFGGYLELARMIVTETLTKRQAAGIDVRTAMKELDQGVQQYGFGNYKSAYTAFRSAYQKSVN